MANTNEARRNGEKEKHKADEKGISEVEQIYEGTQKMERLSHLFQSKNPQADSMKLLEAIKGKNFGLVNTIFNENRNLGVDVSDDVGKTALHYLCNFGQTTEIQLCLSRHPDINKTDKLGWTPLHYAAMKGYTEVVQLLVDNGANVNKPDNQEGRTPLHLAITRDHQDTAELLVSCGADPKIANQDGKTAAELSRNEYMKDRLEQASSKKQKELSEVTVETMDISTSQPTPFPNLGLTVLSTRNDDSVEHTTFETNSTKSFTMSIRKCSPDKLDDKFTLADTEDVCSDVFTHKIARASGPTDVDISIPILAAPPASEELVLKTDNGEEIVITNIKEEDGKCYCIATADVATFSSFVVVSRPKLEKFSVGTAAAHIKSTVDERVELDIPKGTFDKPVTLTMEITETPKEEDLTRVMSKCADISSTTSFYSLDSGGSSLSKPIAVKVPLPSTYVGNSNLLIFTMNDDPAKETPESWKLMSAAADIKGGRIAFDVPSFSIKVAVEITSPVPDNSSDFGSSTSLGSFASQISQIYRKSRRKEHSVTFVCMTRRVGTSNKFRAIVICCKLDQRTNNISYFEGEGYENQGDIKLSDDESELRARAKQVFKVKSKTLDTGEQTEIYVTFQPKLEKSYQQFTVAIPSNKNVTTGLLDFYKVEKKLEGQEIGDGIENEEKIASLEVSFLKFDTTMMEQLDGRSFLTNKRMVALQKHIDDIWWKVLLLMDIPFKKIEKTLSDNSGSLEENVNGFLFDWKEKNRSDKSRGVPILMAALCRCGKRLLVNELQRELRDWKDDPRNRSDAFYEWLIMAYKYDLLVPTRYDSPMSDTFLAMLADQLNPTTELAEALSVPTGIVSDVLANNKTYPTDGLKSMKILDYFRMGMGNRPQALKKLVQGLKDLKLNKEADYTIMLTGAWLKRQGTGNEFTETYKSLTQEK